MDHEARERAAFVRWMKKSYPGVSTERYRKPCGQYLVEQVEGAWKGWHARSLAHAERKDPQARALRVIHTWAGIAGGLHQAHVRRLAAEALGIEKEST